MVVCHESGKMRMDCTPAQCSAEYQNMEMKHCTWSYQEGGREKEWEEKQHIDRALNLQRKKAWLHFTFFLCVFWKAFSCQSLQLAEYFYESPEVCICWSLFMMYNLVFVMLICNILYITHLLTHITLSWSPHCFFTLISLIDCDHV